MIIPGDIPKISVLGSRVPVITLQQAVGVTESLITNPGPHCAHIVNTGFHGIWMGKNNPQYRSMLNAAEFWVPDGVSFALIARARGCPMKRIGGPDYVKAILKLSEQKKYRHFFYGDTPDTLAALRARLGEDYPKLEIAGMHSPPFRTLTPEEDDEDVRMINDAGPHVLWVGLGCPKQERWIAGHKRLLDVPVACGIGAIFAFLAGTVRRAPAPVQKIGMEWAWRLASEPRKCYRRCLIDGPQFLFHVGRELLGKRGGA